MYIYNVLMSDNSVIEVAADYPESAERKAEEMVDNSDVFAVIAEGV